MFAYGIKELKKEFKHVVDTEEVVYLVDAKEKDLPNENSDVKREVLGDTAAVICIRAPRETRSYDDSGFFEEFGKNYPATLEIAKKSRKPVIFLWGGLLMEQKRKNNSVEIKVLGLSALGLFFGGIYDFLKKDYSRRTFTVGILKLAGAFLSYAGFLKLGLDERDDREKYNSEEDIVYPEKYRPALFYATLAKAAYRMASGLDRNKRQRPYVYVITTEKTFGTVGYLGQPDAPKEQLGYYKKFLDEAIPEVDLGKGSVPKGKTKEEYLREVYYNWHGIVYRYDGKKWGREVVAIPIFE